MELSAPATVVATGRVHVWRDGLPFYVFDRDGGTFTLPAGTYRIEGGALLGPMKPRKGAAPPRPRYPLPRRVTLHYGDVPQKAQIDLRRGVVYLDNSFRDAPEFVRTFILLHEIGHYFFQDEQRCDKYAAAEMFRRGYNPSQIEAAASMTLSASAADRIAATFETVKTLENGQ